MFVQAYINTAKEILNEYSGHEPFNSFLEKFFKENKKFGSRDRKQITQLCYCFFRIGKSLGKYSVDEKLNIALYLCNNTSSPVLEKLNPEWNKTISAAVNEKVKLITEKYQFVIEDVFPWPQYLSPVIDYNSLAQSFFIQPDIYLRLRPGKEISVQRKLSKAQIPFQQKNPRCIAVAPFTKLDEILEINNEAVVQDLNSQRVIEPLMKYVNEKEIKTAWDSCAASGGKSILLYDTLPHVQLTVSDIRESILINLTKRFSEAGITGYKKIVTDIAAKALKSGEKFDLIICDAPCSGSGTWSRTPEQLYFFDETRIDYYSALQKRIVTNAAKNLRKGGYFLYITCSVFKNENEEVASFIEEKLSLTPLNLEYFVGYNQKADTLFTALFVL